jgi:hypothetical protein
MHGVYYNSILPNTGRRPPTSLCDHGATVKGDLLWRTYKGGALCALDTSHAKLSHLVGEAVHSYRSAAEISVLSWIRQLLRTTWRLSQLLYDDEASTFEPKKQKKKEQWNETDWPCCHHGKSTRPLVQTRKKETTQPLSAISSYIIHAQCGGEAY